MIELRRITRSYAAGAVHALDNVSLTIEQGEFVAIIGASGSGKSTLMHILGLLDRPDSGSYMLLGRDVTGLSNNELAILRNNLIGFVFQQFHLLPKLSAVQNACLPLIYSGRSHLKTLANKRIEQVGLGHRASHRPNQLSGGEQQRVAIARALVNEPLMIMADEPTGNLDSKSRTEIIAIFKDLNRHGKTIVMVTHEKEIAEHAGRIIAMSDGKIVSDTRSVTVPPVDAVKSEEAEEFSRNMTLGTSRSKARVTDHLRQAFASMIAHRMRSFLSMLGILIGVAAVITMLAVTQGAQDSIKASISYLGSNLLYVFSESRKVNGVRMAAGTVSRLTLDDTKAIAQLQAVKSTSPTVYALPRPQLVYGNKNWNSQVLGVGVEYAEIHASVPQVGRFFTEAEIETRQRVVVLGLTVVKNLFGETDPIGKTIKMNRVSFTVIGILPPKGATTTDMDDVVVIPVTTAMHRLNGQDYIHGMDVEVRDAAMIAQVEDEIKGLLARRHKITGNVDDVITILCMTDLQQALSKTTRIMGMLLGSIAAISLVVGGVGIMNIMLVSVNERTREIGLRKAIGARRGDIMTQFLIEATVMTLVGGLMGIALGVGTAQLLGKLPEPLPAHVTAFAVIMAATFSVAIGLIFGIWPARQAAKLDPIEALRYE